MFPPNATLFSHQKRLDINCRLFTFLMVKIEHNSEGEIVYTLPYDLTLPQLCVDGDYRIPPRNFQHILFL